MSDSSLVDLHTVLAQVTDPRKAKGVRHPFPGILSLVFLGLLGRIVEMAVLERWATVHWEQLKKPLGFTRDKPPCDTTISRALARFSLEEFRQAFAAWLNTLISQKDESCEWVAAVDGKTCCQGLDAQGKPVLMLNVFLQRIKVTLDQWSVSGDKTNEPGSLKKNLEGLLEKYPALKILTADAIYAQRPLLKVLRQHGCDYIVQIKDNQLDVHDALQVCFQKVNTEQPHAQMVEKKAA